MRYEITQYFPNFFEGFESQVDVVDRLRDMLQIPYLKEKTEDPNFDHWEINKSPNNPFYKRALLIKHYTDGVFHVMAIIRIVE